MPAITQHFQSGSLDCFTARATMMGNPNQPGWNATIAIPVTCLDQLAADSNGLMSPMQAIWEMTSSPSPIGRTPIGRGEAKACCNGLYA